MEAISKPGTTGVSRVTKAAYIRHVFVFVACIIALVVALLALAR